MDWKHVGTLEMKGIEPVGIGLDQLARSADPGQCKDVRGCRTGSATGPLPVSTVRKGARILIHDRVHLAPIGGQIARNHAANGVAAMASRNSARWPAQMSCT